MSLEIEQTLRTQHHGKDLNPRSQMLSNLFLKTLHTASIIGCLAALDGERKRILKCNYTKKEEKVLLKVVDLCHDLKFKEALVLLRSQADSKKHECSFVEFCGIFLAIIAAADGVKNLDLTPK